MKNFTMFTLLITAAAIAFPVLAFTPDERHQQRTEQRRAEEPDQTRTVVSDTPIESSDLRG